MLLSRFTPNFRFVSDVHNDLSTLIQKHSQREYARKKRWCAREKIARNAEEIKQKYGHFSVEQSASGHGSSEAEHSAMPMTINDNALERRMIIWGNNDGMKKRMR